MLMDICVLWNLESQPRWTARWVTADTRVALSLILGPISAVSPHSSVYGRKSNTEVHMKPPHPSQGNMGRVSP